MRRVGTVAAVSLLLSIPFSLSAATTCVNTAVALQSALTAAQANGQDDVIQVVQGTYTPAATFTFSSSENHSFQLLGGFTSGCAARVLNPTNTILDGGGTKEVLDMTKGSGSSGDLLLEGFTIRNGNSVGPTGAFVAEIGGATGSVTVRFNIFNNNHATFANGGGLHAAVNTGSLNVSNNLMYGNSSAGGDPGGADLVTRGGSVYVVNNTVTGNTTTASAITTGGLRVAVSAGTVSAYLSNNIIWGNTQYDLDLSGPNSVTLNNDDIGTQSGTAIPTVITSGEISVDPKFVSASDFHLQGVSTAINAGTATPAGGAPLPSQDLDGNARTSGSAPDMGAYEFGATVVNADVSISKSGTTDIVAGNDAVYTITVMNNGPASAANVIVTDPLPTGVTWVSNSGGCTNDFPCHLGTIASGNTVTITTTYHVPPGFVGTSFSNIATVTTDSNDPNSTNNSSTATTNVSASTLPPPTPALSTTALLLLGAVLGGAALLRIRS